MIVNRNWHFVTCIVLLFATLSILGLPGPVFSNSQSNPSSTPYAVNHSPDDPLPSPNTGMYVVFGIVILALFMFIYQPVPMDITAITVMVLLILLEPWTQISPAKGLSGFASPATITVLAMFILSEGIRKSGIIQKIGARIIEWTGDNISRQLSSIVGIVVPTSGMINNTAVVAILLPIVSDMARKTKTSPSKLLIPLSYASMFGGMLTLIGTSTNLLASDLSTRLLNRPIGMFEFTHVGIIVSLVGSAYLIWICPYILPERIKPEEDLTRQFDMENYLTEVIVVEGSTLIGKTAENAFSDEDVDADILRIVRGDNRIAVSLEGTEMQQGDILSVRTDRKTLLKLIELDGLQQASPPLVDETNPSKPEHKDGLVEVVIVPGSPLVGESMKSSTFRQRYNASVLALRHGEQIIHERMDERELEVGNTLLVQASPDTIKRLKNNNDFIVTQEIERPDFRTHKIPLAITITLGVIITASTGLLTILEAALSGVLAMVFTGCLKPGEVYDSVRWDIIFLLAGVIPLGLALEYSGGADLIAGLIVRTQPFLPDIAFLILLYLVTAFLTNIISNNASVLIMIPVAIDTALRMGTDPFPFLLVVMFAASTAFMTPMGYQTNLFVYGPGGYNFRDYLRAGTVLQLLLAVVTSLSIAFFWPL